MNGGYAPTRLVLLRKLFWSRQGVLLLSMSLLSMLGLVFAGMIHSEAAKGILFAMATGILASAVFTSAQILMTFDANNDVLVQAVVDGTRTELRTLGEQTYVRLTAIGTKIGTSLAAIAERNEASLVALSDEYRRMSPTYLPTHVFDATREPEPNFNRLLMEDLNRSDQYLFRGLTGRHTAAAAVGSRSSPCRRCRWTA